MKTNDSIRAILKIGFTVAIIFSIFGMFREAEAADEVYVVKVEGLVDNGMHAYIQRTINAAENNNARGVI